MGVPTLGVCYGNPAHDLGEFSILAGPQKQMKVIGHETVCGNADSGSLACFLEDLFKSLIIGGFLK